MEENVAEDKATKTDAAGAGDAAKKAGQKPMVLIGLVVVNMLVVLGVGFMVWKGQKAKDAHESVDHVVAGEEKTKLKEDALKETEIGKVIPLETFVVNLAGSKGRKVLKVNMELEVKGNKEGDGNIIAEIDTRKAQIRDFIIIILSSKSYEEVSTKDGKDFLRNEIKDNINTFLSKGKITNVFFTEIIYN
ncbi:flagellar protein FliL [Bdellovibrio sp. qaytius]|nr:flagellar protein FliL [Bdellovibrio sp. qaytius]